MATAQPVTELPAGFTLDPAELPAGFEVDKPKRKLGVIETALRTVGEAAIPIVRTLGLAESTLQGIFRGDEAQQQTIQRTEETTQGMQEMYAVKPDEEASTAGRVIGGVASMPEAVLGQGVAPGINKAAEVVKRGGTMRQAATAGGVTGAVEQALLMLPTHLGGKVAEKVGEGAIRQTISGAVTGAAVNVPAGIAGQAVENAATPEGEQFQDLKQEPFSVENILTQAGLSAALGAVGARTAAKAKAARENAAPAFPKDKMEDLGDGKYRAPNGSEITEEMWANSSKRLRDGWMEEVPKPEPEKQSELEKPELDRLREEHPQGPVADVLNEVAKRREKTAKAKEEAAQLRHTASQTTDVEIKRELLKRADKLDPQEKVPVGETKEGQPPIAGAEPPKKIAAGEATETPEPYEGETVPKGEASEALPTGEATEIEPIPAGEAREIPSGVEPTEEPKAGTIPTGETKELFIPPEKRNASDQVTKPQSSGPEHQDGGSGGQAAEAGDRDRAGRAAESGRGQTEAKVGKPDEADKIAEKLKNLYRDGSVGKDVLAETNSILAKEPDRIEAARKLQKLLDKHAGAGDEVFDIASPKELTFPKIEASMIDASEREANRRPTAAAAEEGKPLRVEGVDERGAHQVRNALRQGMREGTVHREGGELALWALEKNPNLARGAKMTSSAKGGPGLGLYDHAARLIELFKGHNARTPIHEILHHAERMMPEIVQAGVRREWKRALIEAVRKADTPLKKQAIKDMMASAFKGDREARARVLDAMREGKIDKEEMYHLLNPSEFWAVNAARLLHERFASRGSWRDQAKRWLKELVEKAKGMIGIRSDAPLLKAIDEVLNPKKVRGERSGAKILAEGGGRAKREVPRDFEDLKSDEESALRKQIDESNVRIERLRNSGMFKKMDFVQQHDVLLPMIRRNTALMSKLNDLLEARNTARDKQQLEKIRDSLQKTTDTLNEHLEDIKTKRTLGEETRGERVERSLFDRFNRVAKLQKAEAPKSEKADIYLADTLFQGRAQHRGDVLERDSIKPLGKALEAAKKVGLSTKDADEYLMALHAPERNREIAKINPKMPDGGSGLTNKQAAKIIADFKPEQKAALDKVAQIVHDMNRKKLDAMVEDGLITPELRDTLNRKYKNYVPLKTLDEEDAFRGIGQGYAIRPTDIKEALGRSSKAGSPIAASMMDAARSIVRGEKARVDRSIWEYAQNKEAHDFIKPYDPKDPPKEVLGRKKDKATGQVKTVIDPAKVRDLTVDLVIDGEPQKVFVPDQILRDQIKKLATVNDPGKLLGSIGKVTGMIGRLLTEFNPAFTLPNAMRDAITVGMRAKAHGLEPGKVLSSIPKAWGTIINYKRGVKTEGSEMYREFLEHGGKTGAYGTTDLTQTLHKLEKYGAEVGYHGFHENVNARKVKNGIQAVAHFMSGANEVVEYATRFAAYKSAREKGLSPARAAAIAKDVSVNFNRSGEHSRAMNAIWVFANASLQGLRNTVVYAKSPAVRAAMVGLAGLGGVIQSWNELIGGMNEDTGEPNINSQNDAVADRNIVILKPDGTAGWKIPLPPEYAWLYALGRRTYRGFTQGDVKKEVGGAIGNMIDAVLPVRLPDTGTSTSNVLKAVTPTAILPIADLLGDNKNFFGQNIVPDRHDNKSPAPYYTTARTSTSDAAKAVSKALNDLTGGDVIRPGASEAVLGPLASPEGMEHVVGSYTGGVGQLALQSKNLAKATIKGEAIDINKVPVVNRFLFQEPQSYTSRRYKELQTEFEYAIDYEKAGKPVTDPKIQRSLDAYVGAERELRTLFRELRQSAGDEAQKKQVEKEIKSVQSRVIRAYNGQPRQ